MVIQPYTSMHLQQSVKPVFKAKWADVAKNVGSLYPACSRKKVVHLKAVTRRLLVSLGSLAGQQHW